MIKRVDYTTQESITAESGARRPDMVVKLPGGKELAIDAKVPYNAFIEAGRADLDDAQRERFSRSTPRPFGLTSTRWPTRATSPA